MMALSPNRPPKDTNSPASLPGTGITLETTPTLEGTPPPWVPVPANTYQTDATSVYVEIVSPAGNAFYRLRR